MWCPCTKKAAKTRPSDFSSPGAKYAKLQAFISMSEFGFSTGSSALDWLPIDASSSYEWWGRSKVCSKIWHMTHRQIKSIKSKYRIPKSFKWFWLEQMHQASSKVCQGKHVQMIKWKLFAEFVCICHDACLAAGCFHYLRTALLFTTFSYEHWKPNT